METASILNRIKTNLKIEKDLLTMNEKELKEYFKFSIALNL